MSRVRVAGDGHRAKMGHRRRSRNGGFVSISGGRLRLGIFVVVAALTVAERAWRRTAATWPAASPGLQSVVGTGAMICAVTAARRTRGIARAWRVLVIAATTCWLVGEASGG